MFPVPRTAEALDLICERVRLMQERYRVPFLLEHVIHLLPDAPSEFTPAAFLNAITSRTGCGLILDAYNLQCDVANQGLDVGGSLDELNLSSVREMHLAGGVVHRGFQLDIHSRLTDDTTLALAREVLRRAPNLQAVTFELLKEAVPLLGHDGTFAYPRGDFMITLETYQRGLLDLVKSRGAPPTDPYLSEAASSPGIVVVREIAIWWRAFQIAAQCPLVSRVLKHAGLFEGTVEQYFSGQRTSPFVEELTDDFLRFLEGRAEPFLRCVARFERALLSARAGSEADRSPQSARNVSLQSRKDRRSRQRTLLTYSPPPSCPREIPRSPCLRSTFSSPGTR